MGDAKSPPIAKLFQFMCLIPAFLSRYVKFLASKNALNNSLAWETANTKTTRE